MLEVEFKTKDLYEAAYLYSVRFNLVDLEAEGRYMLFVFAGAGCKRASDSYWARTGQIVAKDYADAIRTLKNRLFAGGGKVVWGLPT